MLLFLLYFDKKKKILLFKNFWLVVYILAYCLKLNILLLIRWVWKKIILTPSELLQKTKKDWATTNMLLETDLLLKM